MVQATSCETEKKVSERALEGKMFHSRRNFKNPPPPHMEWISGEFRECAPMPLPSLTVKADIMGESLKALGGESRVIKSSKLSAYADSCCQTCTAGPDMIATLGCPETVLAPTRHYQWHCRMESPDSRISTSENLVQQWHLSLRKGTHGSRTDPKQTPCHMPSECLHD